MNQTGLDSLFAANPLVAIVFMGIMGAIFGSFIAALVARWPKGQSVLHGRSHCDSCTAQLKAHELLPIISWLLQRGKCRRCGAEIGHLSLVIESLAVILAVTAQTVFGSLYGAFGAIFGWILLALAALDFRHLWLPDKLTATLATTGIAAALLNIGPPLPDRVVGGLAGFAALWIIAFAYRKLRGREGLGQGDAKMLGAIGCWLGWQALPLVLMGASLLGLVYALLNRRTLDGNSALPLGSFMAVAAWCVWMVPAI